jgi:hypothetical protein
MDYTFHNNGIQQPEADSMLLREGAQYKLELGRIQDIGHTHNWKN